MSQMYDYRLAQNSRKAVWHLNILVLWIVSCSTTQKSVVNQQVVACPMSLPAGVFATFKDVSLDMAFLGAESRFADNFGGLNKYRISLQPVRFGFCQEPDGLYEAAVGVDLQELDAIADRIEKEFNEILRKDLRDLNVWAQSIALKARILNWEEGQSFLQEHGIQLRTLNKNNMFNALKSDRSLVVRASGEKVWQVGLERILNRLGVETVGTHVGKDNVLIMRVNHEFLPLQGTKNLYFTQVSTGVSVLDLNGRTKQSGVWTSKGGGLNQKQAKVQALEKQLTVLEKEMIFQLFGE